jgi:hypothetical protein
MVKERNPITVIILLMCTCGIYGLYWLWKTSEELIELGATLPPVWYIIVPFLNFFYMYKYLEEWHRIFKFEQDFMMVIVIGLVFSPIVIYWIQTELNTKAT